MLNPKLLDDLTSLSTSKYFLQNLSLIHLALCHTILCENSFYLFTQNSLCKYYTLLKIYIFKVCQKLKNNMYERLKKLLVQAKSTVLIESALWPESFSVNPS